MQKSKERAAKAAYDSLGRLFVLESRFRMLAQHQLEQEQKDLSKQLYKAYRLL